MPDQVFKINKYIDVPVLYNSSEELYYENSIEKLKEILPNANEIILRALIKEASNNNLLDEFKVNDLKAFKRPLT